jgi:hypothetical protein
MKSSRFKSAGIGAAIALVCCVAYLLLGPMHTSGEPEAAWAKIVFFPGIWVGTELWWKLSWPTPACQAAGVFTMMLVGAGLGAIIGRAGKRRSQGQRAK